PGGAVRERRLRRHCRQRPVRRDLSNGSETGSDPFSASPLLDAAVRRLPSAVRLARPRALVVMIGVGFFWMIGGKNKNKNTIIIKTINTNTIIIKTIL